MLASNLCHPRLLPGEERLHDGSDAFRVYGKLEVAAGIDMKPAVRDQPALAEPVVSVEVVIVAALR
jgi:hypothetical protein